MRKHLKDYFIPHEGNDYTPRSLQKVSMVGIMLLVLLSFTLANLQYFLITSNWMVGSVLPSVIVDLVNTERSGDSLVKLQRSPVLDAAAQMKANDMAKYSYFAHFSPTGVSPWFFFSKANYNFVNAGENLAVHFTDTAQLVDAWVASPTHRANIMNGAYTETGIGVAEGEFEGYKTLFVVQFFGTPAGVPPVVTSAPIAVVQAQESEVVPVVLSNTVTEQPTVIPSQEVVAQETQPEVLAESVNLSETVKVVKADPVPVVIEKKVITNDIATDTAEELVPASTSIKNEERESLYSDFFATTTGGIPAYTDPTQTEVSKTTPYFFELLTQPTVVLQILYIMIGLLILVSLIFSIFIEIRKQHPVQIAYSIALLLLMFGLFKIQLVLSMGTVII